MFRFSGFVVLRGLIGLVFSEWCGSFVAASFASVGQLMVLILVAAVFLSFSFW